MTVQEYLRDFLAELGPLSEEERQQISDYYQELICEGLERGMREEEILSVFGSPAEAAAKFREENGLAQPVRAITAPAEGTVTVLDLRTEGAPVEVIPAGPGELRIGFEPRPDIDEVESVLEDGVWHFRHSLRKSVSRFLTRQFWRGRTPGIQVLVPENFAGRLLIRTCDAKIRLTGVRDLAELSLTTSNAAVKVEDASASVLRVRTDNGGIRLINLGANDLAAVTDNARIEAEAIRGGQISLKTGNAFIHAAGLEGSTLTAVTSNGRIQAEQCSFSERAGLTTSNGAVVIDRLDCPDIALRTSNGPITGTVCGEMREYVTEARTSNAGCNVPNLHGPDRQKHFSAHTDNARIAVEFVRE